MALGALLILCGVFGKLFLMEFGGLYIFGMLATVQCQRNGFSLIGF